MTTSLCMLLNGPYSTPGCSHAYCEELQHDSSLIRIKLVFLNNLENGDWNTQYITAENVMIQHEKVTTAKD